MTLSLTLYYLLFTVHTIYFLLFLIIKVRIIKIINLKKKQNGKMNSTYIAIFTYIQTLYFVHKYINIFYNFLSKEKCECDKLILTILQF